ncbi:MAG: ribbon-helix-helix protein, CopG family [Oscillospiraceae bacterium]|nr:ribbon-helix-helix protein, CopG family [Oscillospiraceae bacterium]
MENEQLIIKPRRPKGEDGHRVFSIRVREDIAEQLDTIAAKTGRSRNELINLFLDFALQRCVVEPSAEE